MKWEFKEVKLPDEILTETNAFLFYHRLGQHELIINFQKLLTSMFAAEVSFPLPGPVPFLLYIQWSLRLRLADWRYLSI